MDPQQTLQLAQRYLSAVEARDPDAVATTLSDDVRHVFPISEEAVEHPGAIFDGKAEVMDYVSNLFRKFSLLRWPDAEWMVSLDGAHAFMRARGDAVVSHSGEPYRNTYLIAFDVADGLITRVEEYANSALYLAQGIEPIAGEIAARDRAAGVVVPAAG